MFQNPYASLMGQNPYYNQPMNNQQFLPQEQPQALIRVNGIDGAKTYQMSANSTVALFDSNEDIMYIKTTDGAGFPSIRTFNFVEITQSEKSSVSQDYISRQEFEDFKKELMNNGKQSIQRTKSINDKSSNN